jgi:hypothetical protein
MPAARASPVLIKSEPGSALCFDAFSSREPVPTPDQVRGRLSLEIAITLQQNITKDARENRAPFVMPSV